MSQDFDADSIVIREMREITRMRPGMFIGGTDSRALHHLIDEVMDHMLEGVFMGRCHRIELTLQKYFVVELTDYSEGLPLEIPSKSNKSMMELLMTQSGIRRNKSGEYYFHGGLHNTGVYVVNFLSSEMEILNRREGYLWQQTYQEGKPTSDVEQVRPLEEGEPTGTTFIFHPDFTILERNEFDREKLANRCQELAYLIPELEIILIDERGKLPIKEVFHKPKGLHALLEERNHTLKSIHEIVGKYEKDVLTMVSDDTSGHYDLNSGISIVFQFLDDEKTFIKGYVNTIETDEGGTHLDSLEYSLTKLLNSYLAKKYENVHPFTWDELKKGFCGVVSLLLEDPQYEGTVRRKLMNFEAKSLVHSLLQIILTENPHIVDRIIEHHLNRRK